jgi:hypothetical protein
MEYLREGGWIYTCSRRHEISSCAQPTGKLGKVISESRQPGTDANIHGNNSVDSRLKRVKIAKIAQAGSWAV